MRRSALSLAMLLAAPIASQAADVWHVYPSDSGGGTIAVLDAGEVESPEPFWRFAMSCFADEPWQAVVSGVDAAALGAAIAEGADITIAVIGDGDESMELLSGYYPELRFSHMFGEWEYTTEFDLSTIDSLAAAGTLKVKGTGVDFPLPSGGAKDLTAFKALCAALPAEG